MASSSLNQDRTEATETAIQEFWTDNPMIHRVGGFDPAKSTPEEIFQFVESLMRDRGSLMQAPDAPILSNYIDYDSLRGKRALEIGYGVGWLVNELRKVCDRVDGIDLSRSHYHLSSHRFRDEPKVQLQIASAEAIPFADNTFDFVTAYGVLHHASSDRQCYAEVHRVLKKGGRAFLMLYRRGGPKFWWRKVIRKGLLGGGLRRAGWDFARFIYSVTDAYTDDSPGAPISRHYTRSELVELFSHFAKAEFSICGNSNEWDDLPFYRLPLTNLLPRSWREKLTLVSGAYWMVTLEK